MPTPMPTVVGTSIDIGSGPHLEILKSVGFFFREVSRSLDLRKNDQLISALTEADTEAGSVIAGAEPYPRNVIEALPKLHVIARSGVGYDVIDLAACDRSGRWIFDRSRFVLDATPIESSGSAGWPLRLSGRQGLSSILSDV
jgi:hypothetical protein